MLISRRPAFLVAHDASLSHPFLDALSPALLPRLHDDLLFLQLPRRAPRFRRGLLCVHTLRLQRVNQLLCPANLFLRILVLELVQSQALVGARGVLLGSDLGLVRGLEEPKDLARLGLRGVRALALCLELFGKRVHGALEIGHVTLAVDEDVSDIAHGVTTFRAADSGRATGLFADAGAC